MITKFAALATILAAGVAVAPAADAAGGVRLGFGGPLGTFTATPSKGAASRAVHGPRVVHAGRKSRARAPVREAAKKPEKLARIASAERAPREVVAKADITSNRVAPLTGSSALIQSALPDREAQEMPAQTGTGATAEAPAERKPTADTEATESGPAQEAARGTATCSKFIPAVGMTVTVACDE